MHDRSPARRVAVTALVAVGCLVGTPGVAGAKVTERSRLTTSGLGPIKIGLSVSRARVVSGHKITQGKAFNPPCNDAILSPRSLGVSMLTTADRIAVIYVDKRGISTPAGIRVGDTVRRLRAVYGRHLVRVRDFYGPKLFDYELRVGHRKVVFTTDNRRVKKMFSGRKPEVDYVEGCA